MELTRSVEVGSGGRIELFLPELRPGERVEIHIQTSDARVDRRPQFGRLRGLVKINDNFDDPLPEFEEYS